MHWEFVTALFLAVPIISLPLVVWYSDIGRGYTAIYRARRRGAGGIKYKG